MMTTEEYTELAHHIMEGDRLRVMRAAFGRIASDKLGRVQIKLSLEFCLQYGNSVSLRDAIRTLEEKGGWLKKINNAVKSQEKK